MGKELSPRAIAQWKEMWSAHKGDKPPRGPRANGPNHGPIIRIAKADEQINSGSYGNVKFWFFDEDGTATASDEDSVRAYDWLLTSGDDIASASKLVVCFVGQWVILAAECPA